MEQRLIDEATEKFVAVYKKTPKECGLTEIGIYEKQNAFLYAHSKEEIVVPSKKNLKFHPSKKIKDNIK